MLTSSGAVSWSSRLIFLLAAVGASVGLGNFWRFTYLAGTSGGGAFVLVYLAAVSLIAVPILMAELLVGRRGGREPVGAMAAVADESGRSREWGRLGALGIVAAFLILSYYSVIAGWALSYVLPTLTGAFSGAPAPEVSAHFDALLADPLALIGWHTAFMALTVAIVAPGLRSGIERAISIMMPALFVMLLVLVGYALIAGDVARGLAFLFRPDLGKVDGAMVLAAVGQAFFSIGVGMGMMMTYGAYLAKDVSITRSAFIIAGTDTLVAVLAGVAIFPLVFANGLDPGQGPGLVFVTLPIAFGAMPGGSVFGGVFFVLLVFAALTSAIASMEPATLWASERFGWRRAPTAIATGIAAWIVGLGTVLSFNAWRGWHPLGAFEHYAGRTFYDLLDYATSTLMMPVSALLLALFVGWRMRPDAASDELGLGTGVHFGVWRTLLLRWLVPAAILAILISGL